MTALILTMTTAGLGRFTAAQTDNGVDLTVTHVGLSATAFVAAPTLTALPGEFRRIATVSGTVVDSNIVHMTVQDDAALTYSVRGFGLFLADGTLFAAYSQPTVLVEKSLGSMLGLAIDIAFPQSNVDNIRFGDTSFLNPPATTDRKGVVELATLAEAQAGDATRVTTGAVVKAMIAALSASLDTALAAVTEAIEGLRARTIYGSGLVRGGGALGANITLTVDAATAAQVRDGTAGHVAITPVALRQAYSTTIDGTSWRRVHPDGWIEMGGIAASRSNEGAFALAFDPPFPNACLGVDAMTRNTNMTVDGQTTIQEVTLYPSRADLFVQNHQSAANEAGGFRWRAWGY